MSLPPRWIGGVFAGVDGAVEWMNQNDRDHNLEVRVNDGWIYVFGRRIDISHRKEEVQDGGNDEREAGGGKEAEAGAVEAQGKG